MKSGVGAALVVAALGVSVLAHDPPLTTVTWNGDIQRLVHARCVGCHSRDGKGPMSLATYEDARPYASAMREEVLARRMPKWHAARGYGQFANDPTLSPFDIALIVAWVDGGAVRGSAKTSAALPMWRAPAAATRKVTVRCSQAVLPPGMLVAITPALREGASAGFAVTLPGGRHEILAWVRDYEREFAETYWLERPLPLGAGARLRVEPSGGCQVTLHYVTR